jgi:hypothetical protein
MGYRRPMRSVVIGSLLVLAALAAAGAGDDPAKKTPEQLKKGIENQHPSTYYILAQKLFESGKKDEAVFWFYAGQLRYRFHLMANPNLEPSGDPALLASLSEVIGRPINEYAFGDLKTLEATMQKVLAWDEATRNGFTSTKAHHAEWLKTREGLAGLRQYVMENGESIRAQRKAHGLPNRN